MAVEHPVEWRQSSYRFQNECLTAGYGSRSGKDGGLTPATGKPSSALINPHQAGQVLLSKIFGYLLIVLAHVSPAPPRQTAQRHGSKTFSMRKGNGKGRRSFRPSMATHLCSGESSARLRRRKASVGLEIFTANKVDPGQPDHLVGAAAAGIAVISALDRDAGVSPSRGC